MLSFIKKYAVGISHVEIYPKVALIIFFAVFLAMIYYAFAVDRKEIEKMARIPLD
ncbi:MAG: hypothetical protein NZM35_07145 [Chitinophagales bacterium]|nr:hypothetical protein [Chitinophagales bacterium]MDW8419000.1 hypothetical protein [Chitinophagales bacterium]